MKTFSLTTRMDASLRDALQSSVHYFAIVLGLAFAFVYLGIDVQNVALIASALSIGIGFGLQSIVSNFISGLILLSERRIRKGDWVVIGSEEGVVRSVAIRATEIETFDNATVVIPNSNLVSGVVKNWLMPDRTGRIRLAVSVCYQSDTDRVVKVLTECARRHPEVMDYPEPVALLTKFADSGSNSNCAAASAISPSIPGFAAISALRSCANSEPTVSTLPSRAGMSGWFPIPQLPCIVSRLNKSGVRDWAGA